MAFNEDTRVKIPAILHLCKLGYEYISLSSAKYDESTNIFTDIFAKSINKINGTVWAMTATNLRLLRRFFFTNL